MALLVEVADTSYALDAGEQLGRYARDGIEQYWIVNIPARRVEVYRLVQPQRAYDEPVFYGLDDVVPLSLAAGAGEVQFEGIPVREILQDSLD